MDFWRRADAASRHAWPAGWMIFGLLLIGLPFGLPGQAALRPAYALACVFFWSVYRPAALPAPVVAAAGLLLDLLGFSPLGMWAVLLLALQGCTVAARRRLISQGFLITWLVFSSFAAAAAALSWLLQCLLGLTVLPLLPLAPELLFAIGLYPLLAALFIRAHRGPAAAELA